MPLIKIIKVRLFHQIKKNMKLFSIRMGVFAVLFFVFNLLAKKYLFEDQINEKSIFATLVSTIIVCLFLYFLNRKKTTSKDN